MNEILTLILDLAREYMFEEADISPNHFPLDYRNGGFRNVACNREMMEPNLDVLPMFSSQRAIINNERIRKK